ncbi:MAG: hypothetical protein AAF570_01575, partial [Bacteroidota bacterium]
MKTILGYLKAYYREGFHPLAWGLTAVFLGVCIWLNYSSNFMDVQIHGMSGQWLQWPVYLLFFGLPYLFGLSVESLAFRDWKPFRQPGFLLYLLFGMVMLSFTSFFPWHRDLSQAILPWPAQHWGTLLFWNMKRVVSLLLPLYIFYRIFDRDIGHFYGWRRTGFKAAPYFWMLLIVLPGVIWASFQPDFLRSYPSYVPGLAESQGGLPSWFTCGLFELVYGLDYAIVELFFRGFLVIGIAKWIGKRTILPMVCVYCFLHFGKPAGEAIASIFG